MQNLISKRCFKIRLDQTKFENKGLINKIFSVEKVAYIDWGMIGYENAWAKQTEISDLLKKQKKEGKRPGRDGCERAHLLVFCHHPHVYTLGKSGSFNNLLLSEEELKKRGATFFKINRGGDITYHGPGQLVGYPIFDLECFFTDVHRYVRNIEEAIIRMLADFGIEGKRQKGYTGVWLAPVGDGDVKWRKICAIGVHLSRWVSMHGFALNVNTDLDYFSHIVPCGIAEDDKEVTTMARELGGEVSMDRVKESLKKHFKNIFEFEYLE